MLIRILSALVLLPLFVAALILLPTTAIAVLFGLMAAVAAWEMLWGTGLVKKPRLVAYSAVMAFLVLLWSNSGTDFVWILLAVFVFAVVLLAEVMASDMELPFEKVTVCLAAGLLIPLLFSSLARLHGAADGKFLVLIPFLLSFISDSGAYFAGVFLGKHKLAPKISPKKTVEGLVGGVVAAIVGMLIFCVILQRFFGFSYNIGAACVYGLLGSLAGVFGDLSFSVIKRQTGIKDYGNLIPGHGGILDRFDSTIFIAPLVEILMTIWPVMVR